MSRGQKYGFLNYLAALMVSAFATAGTLENAAIQTIIDAWPSLSPDSVRLITTLPPLVSLPFMLVIGGIVGRKVSFRFCAIFGTLLMFVGGVGPYFLYTNWAVIIGFRVLMGIGAGLLVIRNSLLLRCIPKEKIAAYMGYASAVNTIACAIVQYLAGVLAAISWRHTFLCNALAIVCVIFMLFFLKEPDAEEEQKPTVSDGNSVPVIKGRLSWRMYFYFLFQLLITMTIYPMLTCVSIFADTYQIATVVVVGSVISSYTIAGSVVGFLIAPIERLLGRATLGISTLCVAAGAALWLFSHTVYSLFIGIIVAGCGYFVAVTMLQVYNGDEAPSGREAFASAVILVMIQVGLAANNIYIRISHLIFRMPTDVESSFLGCVVVCGVLGILCLVLKVVPEKTLKKG